MLANDIVNGQRETVTVSSVSPGGTHRRETHTPCGELVLSPGFSQLVSPKVFPAAKTAPSLGRPGSRARPTPAWHPWARHNPGVSDPRQGPAAMHSLSSSSASVGSPTSLDTQPAGPARGVAWLPPVREDVEANDDVLSLPAVREDVGEDGAALSLGDSAGRGRATREPPSSRAQPPSLDIETAEECVGQLKPQLAAHVDGTRFATQRAVVSWHFDRYMCSVRGFVESSRTGLLRCVLSPPPGNCARRLGVAPGATPYHRRCCCCVASQRQRARSGAS